MGSWSIARAGQSRYTPAPELFLGRTRLGRVGQALLDEEAAAKPASRSDQQDVERLEPLALVEVERILV
jgi:hypothetical protein